MYASGDRIIKAMPSPPSQSSLTVVFSGRISPLQLNKEGYYVPLQHGCYAVVNDFSYYY
jgi:hypothetical protein